MVILISEMKTSPIGFSCTAKSGASAPTPAPTIAPKITSAQDSLQNGLWLRSAVV